MLLISDDAKGNNLHLFFPENGGSSHLNWYKTQSRKLWLNTNIPVTSTSSFTSRRKPSDNIKVSILEDGSAAQEINAGLHLKLSTQQREPHRRLCEVVYNAGREASRTRSTAVFGSSTPGGKLTGEKIFEPGSRKRLKVWVRRVGRRYYPRNPRRPIL